MAGLLGVSPSQPSRWQKGQERISAENQRGLLDLDYVMARLLQLFPTPGDEALRKGQPVIAKVMLRNVIQHWVLIVGKRGTEYLVRDPLRAEMTTLSAVATTVYAIRILEPAATRNNLSAR